MPYSQGSGGESPAGSFFNSTNFSVNSTLSSDNITILGGPSKLEVDLNLGASGTRGSLFFVDTKNPNNLNPNQDFATVPVIFDIFINVNTASEDYLQAYQYVNQDGINTWIPIFQMTQSVYSVNEVVEFEDGQASLNINVSGLGFDRLPFENTDNSFAYFNVQATINNTNLIDLEEEVLPSFVSVVVDDAYFDNSGSFDPGEFPLFLPITLKGLEFNEGTWTPINNKKNIVYLTISFANPNKIFQTITTSNEEES